MFKNILKESFRTLVLISGFAAAVFVAHAAWLEPTGVPPSGNPDFPINIGNTTQPKGGGLILNTVNAPVGLVVARGLDAAFNPIVAFQVNNNGNVGIGVSSPARTLEVSGDGSTRRGIRISQTTANVKWDLNNYETGAPEGAGKFGIFQVGVGTRLIIDTAGNVGIGMNSPTHKLDVNGTAQINGALTVIGGVSATGDICTFAGGGVCLSTVTSGPGGGVTKITGGAGITVTPPAGTGNVTVSLNPSSHVVEGTGEDVRIVRGLVDVNPNPPNNPSIRSGSGFTVTRTGAGGYHIAFSPCFTSLPVLSVLPSEAINWATLDSKRLITQISTARNVCYADIEFAKRIDGQVKDPLMFDFTAIGGR